MVAASSTVHPGLRSLALRASILGVSDSPRASVCLCVSYMNDETPVERPPPPRQFKLKHQPMTLSAQGSAANYLPPGQTNATCALRAVCSVDRVADVRRVCLSFGLSLSQVTSCPIASRRTARPVRARRTSSTVRTVRGRHRRARTRRRPPSGSPRRSDDKSRRDSHCGRGSSADARGDLYLSRNVATCCSLQLAHFHLLASELSTLQRSFNSLGLS